MLISKKTSILHCLIKIHYEINPVFYLRVNFTLIIEIISIKQRINPLENTLKKLELRKIDIFITFLKYLENKLL